MLIENYSRFHKLLAVYLNDEKRHTNLHFHSYNSWFIHALRNAYGIFVASTIIVLSIYVFFFFSKTESTFHYTFHKFMCAVQGRQSSLNQSDLCMSEWTGKKATACEWTDNRLNQVKLITFATFLFKIFNFDQAICCKNMIKQLQQHQQKNVILFCHFLC